MVRTYKHLTAANTDKVDYINNELYPEWIRVAKYLMHLHIQYFYRHSEICDDNSIYKSYTNTWLTERYKACIDRQIVGLLKSKITNFKTKFVEIVMKSNLSDELKKDLCIISKRNLFFKSTDTTFKNRQIPEETIKLGRKIFKELIGNMPSCSHINMVLQSKIVEIQTPSNINNDFKYYLKLSKGNKNIRGEFIYLPILNNPYADKFNGKLSTSCTLNFDNGKLKDVSFTKEITPTNFIKNDIKISFDIGLNILFALNDGSCYGRSYLKKLKKLDKELINVQNKLKKEHGKHVKLSGYPEYSDLAKYIREYSKNEINRILNKIVERYKPTEIILEDLDFQGSELRKTTNRLLNRFGLGIINNKLNDFKEKYNIEITYIDAAYSSQTCSNCNYVDYENRPDQETFHCKCCLTKVNADVNGGRTLYKFNERFGESLFKTNNDRNRKRTLIVKDFVDGNWIWMNDKRIIQVMLSNPYFKDYDTQLRLKLAELS